MLRSRHLVPLLPVLAPLAARWVRVRERQTITGGVPLDDGQIADARAAGVQAPERVRLLCVRSIPTFEHPALAPIAVLTRDVFARTAGITLGHGIMVRSDWWGCRQLVVHELVHVAQYERLGGVTPFLRAYLRECLLEGYPNGELEQEAITLSAAICDLQ